MKDFMLWTRLGRAREGRWYRGVVVAELQQQDPADDPSTTKSHSAKLLLDAASNRWDTHPRDVSLTQHWHDEECWVSIHPHYGDSSDSS